MPAAPDIDTLGAFHDALFRPGQWADAIATIRQRHGLTEPFSQSANGSTVVFLSPRRCIKLHPPFPGFIASHHREVAALRCLAGELPIATPQVLADGALGEWRYFVSTRLPGRPIDAVWDGLDQAARLDLATALGEAIRQLHRLGGEPVARVTEPWDAFRASQRARGLDLERSKGLAPDRVSELERYLLRLDRIAEPASPRGLLHTEIGPSHVLVDEGRITGLIDFGDTMVGDPEYDLAPVGMFVTRGDPAAFRAFCVAYGLDADALADPDRPARLLRHALLHRYATLAWYLDVLAPPSGSLDELATHWFGVR
jgi:hygromycin-B 7''-O-kinase